MGNPDDEDLINSNRQKLRDLDIKKKKKQNYNLSDEDEDDRKMRHDQAKRMKAMEMHSKRARDEKKANKIKHHREDDIANDSDYETQRRKKISELKKLEKQERENRLAKEY